VTFETLKDPDVRAEINDVFERRGMIVFTGCEPSAPLHVEISKVFGPLKDHPSSACPPARGVGVIELRHEPNQGGVVQVDGMTLAKVKPESSILVKTSDDSVPIAFLPEINYYDTLSEKLKWRGDGLSKPKYGHT